MRNRQTQLTPELLEYVEANFTAEDAFLKDMVYKSWQLAEIPQINITGWQGNFLQFIVKSINATNILEIGTLIGYSSIVMARATTIEGQILTIEKDKNRYEYAKRKIAEAGFTESIKIVNANAMEFIKNYQPEQPIDLIFLDADKSNYWRYVTALTPHLRKGGVLVIDNAFAFGFLLDSAPEKSPELAKSMLSFHQKLIAMEKYHTTIVPIGDGMLLAIKK